MARQVRFRFKGALACFAALIALGLHAEEAHAERDDRHDIEKAAAQVDFLKVKPAEDRLNLLSGSKGSKTTRKAQQRLGNGSYLCTPAGFGQRSWCRQN